MTANNLPALFSHFRGEAIAHNHTRTIHYPLRYKVIRLVSYLLILSMLRLQFIFCNCGAIGHFDLADQPTKTSTCCHAECQHKSDSRQDRPSTGSVQAKFWFACEHDDPVRGHEHAVQPRTDSSNRLNANWIISVRHWQWLKAIEIQPTIESRWSERSTCLQSALLSRLEQLRI